MYSVFRRAGLLLLISSLLLLAWSVALAGPSSPGSRLSIAPGPWVITRTWDLRPRLLDPRTGEVVWEGPPLTYLFRGPDGAWRMVPTGTETDGSFHSLRSLVLSRHSTPPAPPEFIRVRHSPYNTCREASPGQIDVLPFEEYVARVLPAEMPALWPMEALKAQAIAVRTYAWYHILQGREDYDVSDWVDYQVMCDAHHPRTDAATRATRGQAVFYAGAPILAMYAAQNGHPTRGADGIPYLSPVPDPVSLGAKVRGHGYGLSQWGAYLWTQRGWNAYQILAHYYPHTYLVLPPDAKGPAGSLLPLELEDMTLGRGYPLTLFAAFPASPQVLTVTAHTAEGETRVILTRTEHVGAWLGAWFPPRSFSSTHPITLTVQVQDTMGRVWPLGEAHVRRDVRTPSISLVLPSSTVNPTFPITVATHSPARLPPHIGIGDDWLWEEEAFFRDAAATVVTDALALDGRALVLPPHSMTYGPYTGKLPRGRVYRAWFRLSTRATTVTDTVVFLDVVADKGETLLGLRALRGIEFPGPGEYREYPVDFYLAEGEDVSDDVEFRVHTLGVPVRLDRVLVTTLPRPWTSRTGTWTLPKQEGVHRLVAKATTPTGLVSPDVPMSITLRVPHPAMTLTAQLPQGWVTGIITYPWFVTTTVAPPMEGGFAIRYRRGDGPWSAWSPQPLRVTSERTGQVIASTREYPDGAEIYVELRGQDEFTYEGRQVAGPLRVDRHPPQLFISVVGSPNTHGWYTTPFTLQVKAHDLAAGLAFLETCLRANRGEILCYRTVSLAVPRVMTQSIPVREEAIYTATVVAKDVLGHVSQWQRVFALDTTPPRAFIRVPESVTRPWVVVRWKGQDAHPVVMYDVDVQVGGRWQPWLQGTHQHEGVYVGRPGDVVVFRVRARDEAGWVGPWALSPPVLLPYVMYVPYIGMD